MHMVFRIPWGYALRLYFCILYFGFVLLIYVFDLLYFLGYIVSKGKVFGNAHGEILLIGILCLYTLSAYSSVLLLGILVGGASERCKR